MTGCAGLLTGFVLTLTPPSPTEQTNKITLEMTDTSNKNIRGRMKLKHL